MKLIRFTFANIFDFKLIMDSIKRDIHKDIIFYEPSCFHSSNTQYDAGYAILKSFALIVGSNPQPYTFDWNYYSNPTYRELIDGLTSRIIELEHFKQQNQLVDNTIVEHELTKLYSEVNPDSVQVANAHDFVKQIDQVYDTIKSKVI